MVFAAAYAVDAALSVSESLEDLADIGGKVQELQYVQMIRFQVESRDQQVLVPEQAVTARRDFVFNKTEILAKERESQFVRQALQRDVVNLAMLRIMAAGRAEQVSP